jgi:hypothetical protein
LAAVLALAERVKAAAAVEAFLLDGVNEGVPEAVHLVGGGAHDHVIEMPIGLG